MKTESSNGFLSGSAERGRRTSSFGFRAIAGLGSSLICALAISWVMRLGAAAPPSPADNEVAAAVAITRNQLLTNSANPRQPEAVQEAAANLSVILHPDLTQREARKDPEAIKAEARAAETFLNPAALHRKKMEDPGYRRNYSAAMESFRSQAQQTEVPIIPSATGAKQIKAVLNDPAWRRQREESLRAAMPPGQVPPVKSE